MRLEIKLKNPKYCDGCQLLHYQVFGMGEIGLCLHDHEHYNTDLPQRVQEMENLKFEDFNIKFDRKKGHYTRPLKCITLNGL